LESGTPLTGRFGFSKTAQFGYLGAKGEERFVISD
jgi:hypothetical protein